MVTTMWARIENGAVAELTDIDPRGRFHPSIEWVACDKSVDVGWSYDSGEFIAPMEAPIDEVAGQAIDRINDGYTRAMATILVEYPDAETLSFDKQEREAREWQAWHDPDGNNGQGTEPATPYLDAMLAERPIGKAELVGRIITKADAFVAAHGAATGRRQRLEDEIKAARQAEDRAALEAIDW